MTSKRLRPVILAGLTLALSACEQSIISPLIPEVEFQGVQFVPTVSGSCVAPGAGLISWWPGDDHFKDVAEPSDDADPNDIIFASNAVAGRTDPLSGTVAFGGGMVGPAFSFTSVQGQPVQFLEIEDADELKLTNFTIDLWAQRTGDGQNSSDPFGSILIMKARDDATAGGTAYLLSWTREGRIVAFVNHLPASLVSTNKFNGGVSPTDVEWVHVALTVEGPTAKLYVNGELDKVVSGPESSQITYGSSGQMGSIVIGSAHEGTRAGRFPRGFHGLIDEVELFGRVLDADEIAAIYNAGDKGKCTGDNEAPIVNELEGGVINEGETFETSVSFTDEDSDSWTATVDYGDGSGIQWLGPVGMNFQLSHTYAANEECGPFTVTVTVTDDALAEGSGTAEVTVIHQISVYNANVSRRLDRFDVEGRLPLSLLACFDPYDESLLTVSFAGFEEEILAATFVHKDNKWVFKASPRTQGIQSIDLRDDGRFKIKAHGLSLRGDDFNFSEPVDFSLSFGPYIGKASIQLDRTLHFRSQRRLRRLRR